MTFPTYHDGKAHPTLPVTADGAMSVDGLKGTSHLFQFMDQVAQDNWAFHHTPREWRGIQRAGLVPNGIELHVWAGRWEDASVHQPTEGSTQPLWRVKSWVPGLKTAEELVGVTGTVITLDKKPSWPVFEVNGTESGDDWGPITQCGEAAHARGQWTVNAVEYVVTKSATAAFQLIPFALLLEPVPVEEVR